MVRTVLIAEDAPDVADIVSFSVRMTWPGCEVMVAESGPEAIQLFGEKSPDLVILDVAIPPPNGFDVCRHIRERSRVPILMLTVQDATVDKVRAFDLGADDYLTKPFDSVELLARLRALVRRSTGSDQVDPGYVNDDLSINFATREVLLNGDVVRLTSTEYRLLEVLAQNAGHVVPHQLLLEKVWGSDWVSDPNYLKVFARRLRQKLGDDSQNPRYIHTEWGQGYRMATTK
jgi:two-component system KDP operon response regulator KdpE